MDDREQLTEQDERDYEPPQVEELDTDVLPAATAAGAQTQFQ